MKLKIEYVNINSIKPYKNNAKQHPREQIEQIKKSIEQFGMDDPIGIWKDEIVEGHGRLIACKELGKQEVPIIRLDHLTDEERKAYTLAHNKLTMNSNFDTDILNDELADFDTIDMGDFGFDLDVDDIFKQNERHRTNDKYNLDLVDIDNSTNDFWQMPIIEKENVIPNDLIELNSLNVENNTKKWNVEAKDVAIHFYMDDYKLERLWNRPEDYINVLSQYKCVLSPDFSLYLDMPMPMKIWNVYRSRQLGHYYQEMGIKVIPTIQWAEKETFEFAFKGIPKGSVVSVLTIGVKRDENALKIWREGMDAMIKEIEPSTILVYGGKLEYDYGNIQVLYYENKVTEKMKEKGRR